MVDNLDIQLLEIKRYKKILENLYKKERSDWNITKEQYERAVYLTYLEINDDEWFEMDKYGKLSSIKDRIEFCYHNEKDSKERELFYLEEIRRQDEWKAKIEEIEKGTKDQKKEIKGKTSLENISAFFEIVEDLSTQIQLNQKEKGWEEEEWKKHRGETINKEFNRILDKTSVREAAYLSYFFRVLDNLGFTKRKIKKIVVFPTWWSETLHLIVSEKNSWSKKSKKDNYEIWLVPLDRRYSHMDELAWERFEDAAEYYPNVYSKFPLDRNHEERLDSYQTAIKKADRVIELLKSDHPIIAFTEGKNAPLWRYLNHPQFIQKKFLYIQEIKTVGEVPKPEKQDYEYNEQIVDYTLCPSNDYDETEYVYNGYFRQSKWIKVKITEEKPTPLPETTFELPNFLRLGQRYEPFDIVHYSYAETKQFLSGELIRHWGISLGKNTFIKPAENPEELKYVKKSVIKLASLQNFSHAAPLSITKRKLVFPTRRWESMYRAMMVALNTKQVAERRSMFGTFSSDEHLYCICWAWINEIMFGFNGRNILKNFVPSKPRNKYNKICKNFERLKANELSEILRESELKFQELQEKAEESGIENPGEGLTCPVKEKDIIERSEMNKKGNTIINTNNIPEMVEIEELREKVISRKTFLDFKNKGQKYLDAIGKYDKNNDEPKEKIDCEFVFQVEINEIMPFSRKLITEPRCQSSQK